MNNYQSDKLGIRVTIGNQKYPITVDRDKEGLYRKAADMVNDRLMKYLRAYPTQDPKSMALLDLAVALLQERSNNDTEPYRQTLIALSKEIEESINKTDY